MFFLREFIYISLIGLTCFSQACVAAPAPPSCNSIVNTNQQCSVTNQPPPAGTSSCAKVCSFRLPPWVATTSGYNTYDVTCPQGYTLLGTRFLSGAPAPADVYPTSIQNMGDLKKQGKVCRPSNVLIPPFTSTQQGGPPVGSYAEFFGVGVAYVLYSAVVENCCPGGTLCLSSGTCYGVTAHSGACKSSEIGYNTCYADPTSGPYTVFGRQVVCSSPRQAPATNYDGSNTPPMIGTCGYNDTYVKTLTSTVKKNPVLAPANNKSNDSQNVAPIQVTPSQIESPSASPEY